MVSAQLHACTTDTFFVYDCRMVLPAAVLQQRIAGMYFCYEAWAKWYTETVKVLQKDLEAATKAKGQDKAGKGAKDSSRDAQGKSKSADKVRVSRRPSSLDTACEFCLFERLLPAQSMGCPQGPPQIVACCSHT